ncbi:unnamed protein product, partial [Urochloa humidicola]
AAAELQQHFGQVLRRQFHPGQRSAMGMDVAHYLPTEPRKDKEHAVVASSKEAYRRLLAGCSMHPHSLTDRH